MFCLMDSTNSLPNGRTLLSVILGCTTYLRSIIGTVCYMWCPYVLHSPLPQHSVSAADHASHALASAVAYLSRSHLSHGRFSRSRLSLAVASPTIAYPLWSLLSRRIFWARISSSPAVVFRAVTFPAVTSLQSHFLQPLVAGLGWV